jgi:zinc and cadmium transporter
MVAWIYSIISVFLISLVSLIGVLTLSLNRDRLEKLTLFLVSFAVGGLFGDAFIHLLPESFQELGTDLSVSLYVILGILIFFVLEKFLRWRHCHISTSEKHMHPLATINLVGDAVHNLIDGMLVGASYMVNLPIGIATTLAVIMHEIPQEVGDFGVLIHGGLSVKKALTFNFLSALTAMLGAILAIVMGSEIEGFSLSLLPITAGGFLYIAGSDLIPELHHEVKVSKSLLQFVMILLGVGVMALLIILE